MKYSIDDEHMLFYEIFILLDRDRLLRLRGEGMGGGGGRGGGGEGEGESKCQKWGDKSEM
jgi:hypothetical protein